MTTNRIKTDRALRSRLVTESGPSTQTMTGRWVDWGNAEDILGQPFDNTRLPFTKLYQMRRDPMIAFGLLFAKLPLVRAPWYIKCSDARIAAFVDNALRAIYGRFIFQYCNCLDFGFAPMEKRFETIKPTWKYEKGGQMLDVWDSKVEALVWKNFTALKPDICEPWWNDDGEFDGIIFRVPNESTVDFSKGNLGRDKDRKQFTRPDIPLERALWATNEKDSVFGSLWGFPRVSYAYRYWWSYWYRWALADRHFEKDSDPPAIVYFPSTGDIDEDGNEIDNQTVALEIGENARSGSTIALPSETITGFDDKPTNMRRWGIEFLEGGGNFAAFENTFAYLDVAKLRSVMVPEQAFLEGQGGTSSRNVAETLSNVFFASQAVLMEEIDYHINRYLIPQLVQANFGNSAPTAEKITRGFASQDLDLAKAIVQLFGQADPTTLEVDMREILTQMGIPLLTPGQVEKEKNKALKEAQRAQPPQTPSFNGFAGVNQWGMYEQPNERIVIDTPGPETIELAEWMPPTPHFEEPEIKSLAQTFRDEWVQIFDGMYDAYATAIEHVDEITLSEDEMLLLARSEDEAIAYANKFLDTWVMTDAEREKQTRRVAGWVRSIMDAAGKREVARLRINDAKWDVESPKVVEWSRQHAGELVTTAGETTKRELRRFITAKLAEPGWDWKQIAGEIREKFPRKWPGWKADRVARTETMLAYNTASLLAYEQNGVTHVRAHDAAIPERSDQDCIDRDGKIFTLTEAWNEQRKEHPNGTLSWSPLPLLTPTDIHFSEHDDLEYKGQPVRAYYDRETNGINFDSGITDEEMVGFLTALSEKLNLGSYATLKRAWDEKKIKRGADGRFTFKPGAGTTGGQQGVPGISNQPQRPITPALVDTADKRKAVYGERKKALEKRIGKNVSKGTAKNPVPDRSGDAGYKGDAGRNAAGKVNQKALLTYAEQACSPYHTDAEGNMVLDTTTTVAKYRMGFTANGEPIYSSQRREIHEKIIDAFLRERDKDGNLDPNGKPLPSQEHPRVLFTGGGYSAGKGFLVDKLFPDQKRIPEDSFTLDPDKIKAALPEFKPLIETDPEANMALYEEAWDIAQEVQRRAQEKKINMIVDGIADTSPDEILGRLQSFADAGYENLDLAYVDVSTEEAMKRAKARAENPKGKISDRRYIPEVIMRSVHRDVSATIDELFKRAKDGQINLGVPFNIEVYDNEHFTDPEKGDKWTGFTYPKLMAKAGPDGVEVFEPEAFAATLNKKNETIPGVNEAAVAPKIRQVEAKAAAKMEVSKGKAATALKNITGGELEIEPELGVWGYKWASILTHVVKDPEILQAVAEHADLVRAIIGMSEQQIQLLPSECIQELDEILFDERSEA